MDFLNPWWRGRLDEDPHISKWLSQPVRWWPDLLNEISLEPPALHLLFGPRQVGKTTLLKLLVKKLVEGGRDPRTIFYYACDMAADYRELAEVLGEIVKLKRRWGISSALILLDEVTYPREWYRALKFFIDQGHFQNDVVIATGSLSMYAKREVETFPGRRGRGKDYVMYPLSFRKFAEVYGVPPSLDPQVWRSQLVDALELYLKCGGFPTSVVNCLTSGNVGDAVDVVISSLSFDLAKLRRSEAYAKRLLKRVLEVAPNPVSLNALAKGAELRSHKIAFSYLSLLEALYVLRQFYYIDPHELSEDYKKPRKIHLLDPLIYQAIAKWTGARVPEPSAILEAVVATHFARRYRVGYWKNSYEVDVVVPELGLGIEVKWARGASGKRLGRISVKTVDFEEVAQLLYQLHV